MLFGLGAPYDWQPSNPAPWRLLEKYRPGVVVISSHEQTAIYHRLLATLPDVSLVVRLKGNRGWLPDKSFPLDSREWSSETTASERLSSLLRDSGMAPGRVTVSLWTEPDIEWTKNGQAPGGGWWSDNDAERWRAWGIYEQTARAAAEQIARQFPGVHLSLAPLSEGNPERYAWWSARYRESGLWQLCDRRVEHAYLPVDRALNDPDWGWRPFTSTSGCDRALPIVISECNNNGPANAAMLANYAGLIRDRVESLSLFILPGGARDGENPSWWLMDDATIGAVQQASTGAAPVIPPEVPKVPNLIKSVDVSSHQAASLPALQQWIAEGCQLLIVKSYQRAEGAALAKSTREHVTVAQTAGCWTLPYVWLYHSVDPRESVRTSLELFRSTGEHPGIMFLDCETYTNADGSIDPGPTVDQIMAAADECRGSGVSPVIYTGNWWLAKIEGDTSKLAGMPVWIANYNGVPDLNVVVPFGLKVIGHQYTDTPQDWSTFDLDALTALSQPPSTDPCAELKVALKAELATISSAVERMTALLA